MKQSIGLIRITHKNSLFQFDVTTEAAFQLVMNHLAQMSRKPVFDETKLSEDDLIELSKAITTGNVVSVPEPTSDSGDALMPGRLCEEVPVDFPQGISADQYQCTLESLQQANKEIDKLRIEIGAINLARNQECRDYERRFAAMKKFFFHRPISSSEIDVMAKAYGVESSATFTSTRRLRDAFDAVMQHRQQRQEDGTLGPFAGAITEEEVDACLAVWKARNGDETKAVLHDILTVFARSRGLL